MKKVKINEEKHCEKILYRNHIYFYPNRITFLRGPELAEKDNLPRLCEKNTNALALDEIKTMSVKSSPKRGLRYQKKERK